MSWASPDDVEARWVGDGFPDDETLIFQLIDDAEQVITFEYPDITDRIVGDSPPDPLPDDPLPVERVQMVIARMVIRHLRNPENTRQITETTGPFSTNRTYAGTSPGELVLTDVERKMLGYLSGSPHPRAFTVPFGGDEGGFLGGSTDGFRDAW